MARLLGDASDKRPAGIPKVRALTIDGVRWTHAAARFWASLLAEVAADYPDCTVLAFETLAGIVLSRNLLFPEMALQHELEHLQPAFRLEQALREALAECELYGPPGAVQLRLLSPAREASPGDEEESYREIKRCELPLDCVDTDSFAYLVAWFMEWAELPESQWNNDRVEGAFAFRYRDDAPSSRLQFEFTRQHISEGLYRWRLRVRREPD